VWLAGVQLSKTTDVLDHRLGIGEALGGLVLLSIATNLPEIAITVSASVSGHLDIAIGNILGGIAIQTVVLVILDAFGLGAISPLTYRAASLLLVLESSLVIAVLVIAVAGTQLPPSLTRARLEPASVLIVVFWVGGLLLLNRARKGLPWQESGIPPDGQKEPIAHSKAKLAEMAASTTRTAVVFTVSALVTLAGGVALESSGARIASHLNMTGVLFGATVLAAATALPEVSTGLQAVRMGDYQLAVSDIFGGNAFLPTGKAVLPQAQSTDIYLTALAVLLTCVYCYGLIFRSKRMFLRMGLDSIVVLVLYVVGIVGLLAIVKG
jgi:cation:H+ antiporter